MLAGEERAWGDGGWEKHSNFACKQLRCSPGTGKRGVHDQKFIVWNGKTATVVSARKAVTLSCLDRSRSVKI